MNISSVAVIGSSLGAFNDRLGEVLGRVGDAGASAEVLPYHFINGHYQTIVIIRREVT